MTSKLDDKKSKATPKLNEIQETKNDKVKKQTNPFNQDPVELNVELDQTLAKLKKKCEILGAKLQDNALRKEKLILKIESCTKRHHRVVTRLNNRKTAEKEYQKTITQTESAYKKIVDSSATLLEVLRVQAGDSDPEDTPDVGTLAAVEKQKQEKERKHQRTQDEMAGMAVADGDGGYQDLSYAGWSSSPRLYC